MWGFSDSAMIGALVVLLVLVVAAWYFVLRRKTGMKRKASFTSLGIAMGTFPTRTEVPDAIINTACYFGNNPPPSVEAIAAQIVEPLVNRYERLSHVLDVSTGRFRPCNRPFQPQDLIRVIDTKSSNESTLHQSIFAHVLDPLTHDKRNCDSGNELPWWEILVFHCRGKGPSAMVIRVHHALADGLALVHAFESIFTSAIDGSPIHLPIPPPKSRPPSNFLATAWSLLQATVHVLTLGVSRYDDDTAFSRCNHAKMKHSGQRDFVIFPTIPLAFVKALKTAANCTVNDVLTTAVSQAIHDYCVSENDAVLATKQSSIQCRALLPVGFPRHAKELADPATALRNKWCMVSCDIAVGCTTVVERLETIRANTTSIKGKPRALVQLAIQNSIPPLLPKRLGRQVVMDVFSRHSLVLTNVPGPDVSCALAGVPMQAVQLFFNNLLSQVNILSYDGQVLGNIVYDPTALNPEAMAHFGQSYMRALLHMAEQYGVEPPSELMQYGTQELQRPLGFTS